MTCFTHSSGQHLRIDDASLYFEVAGNPVGKPLLLLHGGLGNLTDFNGILSKLPEQFRFIGIDFRGHGKSTLGSSPLNYQQYQADVEAVLAHLGIDSCSILGFSDGGIVAYRMAAKSPSSIEALVTLGAQWRLETDGPVFEMLSGLTPEMWVGMFPDSVRDYNAVNPAPNFDSLVKAVVALWTDTQPTGYPNAAIAKISAPTLIVRGDEDHLLSLSEATELREKIKGACFFNIPFAGHEAHKDAPDVFLAAVNEFLVHPRKFQRAP